MSTDNEDHAELVLEKILFVLRSMNPLIVKDESSGKGIYKKDILFCLVYENNIYFNPGSNPNCYLMDRTIRLPFRQLKNIQPILEDTVDNNYELDKILHLATESYWLMSGQKKIESNLPPAFCYRY